MQGDVIVEYLNVSRLKPEVQADGRVCSDLFIKIHQLQMVGWQGHSEPLHAAEVVRNIEGPQAGPVKGAGRHLGKGCGAVSLFVPEIQEERFDQP